MSKIYTLSQTHEDFPWPRVVPLSEKPSQPPVRTGVRLFCPEPDSKICEQENYQDNKQWSNKSKKIQTKDDSVLMSREKFIRLNKIRRKQDQRFESTFQADYAIDELTYDHLIEKINKKSRDETCAKKFKIESHLIDPLPFRKTVDKLPLLD